MLYMKRHAHKGAHRVLETRECKFDHMKGVANHLLRVALGRKAISADSDSEKKNEDVLWGSYCFGRSYSIRKYSTGLCKELFGYDGGGFSQTLKLLALILSAQQHFSDAETIIDASLDETGKWKQGELLRLKAKL